MTCLSDNTFFEMSLGQLEGEALTVAEQHLDGCVQCRRVLAETLRTSNARPTRHPPLVAAGTSVGRYIVIERIGAGAMGQVFSAYDPQLDRKVALKLLRPGSSTDDQRARLAREAQTLARLSHPNVVTVFDVGVWEGQLFITLEFVSGGSARSWRSSRAPGWREVVSLYVQAGRGLAAAHDAGVVHRDFKPDNVLVRADGRAQVTDFGLAAMPDTVAPAREGAPLTLTRSDVLLGTPAYMAADQLEGAVATPASDQFGFCASLFEALTGTRPFEGRTVPELLARLRAGHGYPSVSALVDALEATASRTRRAGLLVLSAVLASGVALLFASSRGAERHPACALAEARQLATWNDARRAQVQRAFTATGLSYADRAFALVDAAVTRRIDAWRPARAEACEAVVLGSSASLFGARLQCLDERWAELEATLGILETNGNDAVARAGRIIERLPGPEVCTQPATLARYGADAGFCERCVVEQAVVAKSRSLFEAGHFTEAGDFVSSALDGGVTGAEARAALHFENARVLEELGKLDEAERGFFVAGLEAQRAGDGPLAASTWVELGYLTGYLRSRAEDGERWVQLGEALAALEGDDHLADRFASVHGVIAARGGHLALAETYFTQAEQLVRAQRGAAHPMRARALSNLGNAQLHQGRVDEALPRLEESWRLLSSALGEEHPDTFQALNSYGAALGEAERYEAAVPIFERALAGYTRTLGPEHPRLGTAALNLAEAERRLGRLEASAAHYAQAAEVWKATDAADRALALTGQAEVRLDQHHAEAALPLLEDAVAICERLACDPIDEGQARFAFARALREAHRSPAKVSAEAQKALALFTPLGGRAAQLVVQVRDFVK